MHQHKLVTPSLNWNDLQCLNCHCFRGRWHNTEICINVHNIYVFLIAVKEIIIIISSVNLIYRPAARSVTMSLYFTGHMPHGMDGGKYRCMFWHLWCLICFLNRFPLKMLRSEEKTIKYKQVVSYKIADFYHNDIQTPFCKHTPSPFFSSQTRFHSLLFPNTINSYSTYMNVNILYFYIYYTML